MSCTESYDEAVIDAATAAYMKATPGPWMLIGDDDDVGGVVVCAMWPTRIKVIHSHADLPFPNTPDVLDNAEFIAGARDWIPRLIVMAKRLRDERDEARRQVDGSGPQEHK